MPETHTLAARTALAARPAQTPLTLARTRGVSIPAVRIPGVARAARFVLIPLLALALHAAADPSLGPPVSARTLDEPAAEAAPVDRHRHHRGDDATVNHRFERAEEWARRFEDPGRDAWQMPDRVVSALVTGEDLVIADIGSATGYFPVRFALACPSGLVLGADIEPEMIFYLNDRARREGISNLISILAAPDDPHLPHPVDLVFICNTYHHIDGRVDYFRRLREQLRPGGRVAVVDYRLDSERGPAHKLAPDIVEQEMGEAGYTLHARHDFLPEQYFLVFESQAADSGDQGR